MKIPPFITADLSRLLVSLEVNEEMINFEWKNLQKQTDQRTRERHAPPSLYLFIDIAICIKTP